MDFAYSLMLNVALLFIMMIPGVIMKKCGLATEGFGKGLSNLVLYIAQPALVNNRTMVPMRKIFEALGATVTWDNTTQTAKAQKGQCIKAIL